MSKVKNNSKQRNNQLILALLLITLTQSFREGVVNLFNQKELIFENNYVSVTENF